MERSSGLGVRWEPTTDAPAELFTEVGRAREALAQGKPMKAQRVVARVLGRFPSGSPSAEGRAALASAHTVAGMAEQELGHPDAAAVHLAAAAAMFESLLGDRYELDPSGRADLIRTEILVGQPRSALALAVRALEAGTGVRPDLLVELAAALRGDGAVQEVIDLLTLAHRREPSDAAIAIELALAHEHNGPSPAAGLAHLDAGVLLAHEGDYPEAERQFRRSTQTLPESAGATAALAQVLLAQDKPGEAIQTIEEGMNRHGATPEIAGIHARAIAQAGDMAGAIEAARAGIATFGSVQSLTNTLVRLLLAAGRADEAAVWVQRGLEQEPGDPDMLLSQAEVLLAGGGAIEAIAILQPLVAEFPESVEYWIALISALSAAGRLRDAVDALSRALGAHPDSADLRDERDGLVTDCLEYAELHLNDPGESNIKDILDGVLTLDDDNGRAHGLLGELLRRDGREEDLAAALAHLDRAAQSRPDSGWIVGTRGQVLAAMGRPEALEELQRAARLDDSLTWVHVELGDAYRLAGRYREAIAELTRATEMEPTDAWAWATRGATEQLNEQWEQARASLDEAIRWAPGYAWALAVKANLLSDLDELDEALKAVDLSLESDPDASWVWGLKAWVLNAVDGDLDAEQAAARRGVELEPADMYLHLCLGEALVRWGRYEEADQEFHSSIDLVADQHPLNPETMANLAWCHLRLRDYPEALRLLAASLAHDYSSIAAQFDLGLTMLCAGRPTVALDQYESAAAMAQAKNHPGRRRSLARVAQHDLRGFLNLGQIADADAAQHIEQILDRLQVVDSTGEAPR